MLLKEEKGIAVTDIAISVIVITIFIAMIGNLIININLNSQETKRKTIATSYAVQEAERIKLQNIETYLNKGIAEPYLIEEDIMDGDSFTGYHKTIIVKDYVLIKHDITKEPDILKEITIEISYKFKNKEEKVQISVYITKE